MSKPLAVFDIESTGANPATDRIVSICVQRHPSLSALTNNENGGWPESQLDMKFYPGFEMTAEVVAIHGITNEESKGYPRFDSQAALVHAAVAGCDLLGFNLLNFDVPVLWEELHRAGIDWDLRGARIIDAGNIYKKMEPRTLTAAVRFYCGRDHEGAHEADADVAATADVLLGQLARYPALGKMNIDELATFSAMEERIDLAGKIVRDKARRAVYSFGNSKGVPVIDDQGFARWMLGKDFTEQTKMVVRGLLTGEII